MTQFDIIVLILLAISGAVGFARGAVREIAALIALFVAAAAAVFSLRFSVPIMRHIVHLDWLATVAALITVFLIVFVLLRLVGNAIAEQIQRTDFLGMLDRSLGLLIGLARGLIVLGSLNLMFNAATPRDLQPHWIIGSTTWPLAQNMGHLLAALAPKGLDIAGRLKPTLDRVTHDIVHDAVDDRLKSDGYDPRQRGEIDDLVEKSR